MSDRSGSDSGDGEDPAASKRYHLPAAIATAGADALRSSTRGMSVRQMVDGKAGAPAVGMGHGGSRDTYFAHKTVKLQQSLNKLANEGADLRSTIFKDCWCFFNGSFSSNSIADLKHTIVINGGCIDQYKSSKTTHYVCDYFTDAQITAFHAVKDAPFQSTGGGVGGLKYVTHQWILQSIARGARLAEVGFLPDGLALYGDASAMTAFLLNDGAGKSSARVTAVIASANRYGANSGRDSKEASTSSGRKTNNANIEIVDDTTTKEGALVKEFHMKSRLSYIGSWRNRLPQLLADITASIGAGGASSHTAPDADRSLTLTLTLPSRLVLHVDLDCFFVSALLAKEDPQGLLRDQPIAVAHGHSSGSSEVSSCNYPARAFDIRAGMYLSTALAKCPHLKILHYDFERYDEVCSIFYRVLYSSGASVVEPVSVDEAYLEYPQGYLVRLEPGESVSSVGMVLAERLRTRIFGETNRCAASVGIGANKLLARVATMKAKPDGKFEISEGNKEEIMHNLELTSLPGIGDKHGAALKERGFLTCGEVLQKSLAFLKSAFGDRVAETIFNGCRGADESRVEAHAGERKSVGAEINYGVRLDAHENARNLITELSKEVCRRLAVIGKCGRQVVFKVMLKKQGSKEPSKFMGHGICDSYSKSVTLRQKVRSAAELGEHVMCLYGEMMARHAPRGVKDVRGVGIQVLMLEPAAVDGKSSSSASSSSSNKRIASYFSPEKGSGVQSKTSPAAEAGSARSEGAAAPPGQRHCPTPAAPKTPPLNLASSSSSRGTAELGGGHCMVFEDFDVPTQVDWAVVREMSPLMAAHIKRAHDRKVGLRHASSSSARADKEPIYVDIDDDNGNDVGGNPRVMTTASQEDFLSNLPSELRPEALRQLQAARPPIDTRQTRSSNKTAGSSSNVSKPTSNKTTAASKAKSKKRQPSVGTLFAVQKLSREVRESGASVAVLAEGIKADAQQQSLARGGAGDRRGLDRRDNPTEVILIDDSVNAAPAITTSTIIPRASNSSSSSMAKCKDAPAAADISAGDAGRKRPRAPSTTASPTGRQRQAGPSSSWAALSSESYEKREINGLANHVARQKPAAVFSRVLESLRQMSGYTDEDRIAFGPTAEGMAELYGYGRYLVASQQLEQASLLARHYAAAVSVLAADNSKRGYDNDDYKENDNKYGDNDGTVCIMNSLWVETVQTLRDAMDEEALGGVYKSKIVFK